jgi:segregation and condensation protein A
MRELKETGSSKETEKKPNVNPLEFNEPTEVLVELARRGEVDPWDIDIAKTTERFLEYIESLERRDLRIPARTLLYASILLRMKSEAMEDQTEEPEEIAEDLPAEDLPEGSLPSPPVRRRTRRPVTLDELISELKKAEMVGRRRAMRELWPEEIPTEIKDPSHEEGIEDRIAALTPTVEKLLGIKEKVSFQEVSGDDQLMNYVSLLFMAQRKQVWLEQEELFGDLYIERHRG